MRLYEDEVNTALIQTADRNEAHRSRRERSLAAYDLVEGAADGRDRPLQRAGGGGRPVCPDYRPGVVADFADRTHTARYILWYEDAVAAGGSWEIS